MERTSGTNQRSRVGRHLVPSSSSVREREAEEGGGGRRWRKELFLRKISGAGQWMDWGGGGVLGVGEGIPGPSDMNSEAVLKF